MTPPEDREIPPARLRARLFCAGRTSVEVPEVRLTLRASDGLIRFDIPYPEPEEARVVHRVAVINPDAEVIARASVFPRLVRPGETLSVGFSADDVRGLAFPGFPPERPDAAPAPDPRFTEAEGDRLVKAIAANLAGLNEIIAEMTAKVSDDPVFTELVRRTLRDHSHAIGFSFQGD
jgi:hypothetical protein